MATVLAVDIYYVGHMGRVTGNGRVGNRGNAGYEAFGMCEEVEGDVNELGGPEGRKPCENV